MNTPGSFECECFEGYESGFMMMKNCMGKRAYVLPLQSQNQWSTDSLARLVSELLTACLAGSCGAREQLCASDRKSAPRLLLGSPNVLAPNGSEILKLGSVYSKNLKSTWTNYSGRVHLKCVTLCGDPNIYIEPCNPMLFSLFVLLQTLLELPTS